MELEKHAYLTKKISMPIYLCDSQCPWPRSTNENTDRLIRQYFPKKLIYQYIQKSSQAKSQIN